MSQASSTKDLNSFDAVKLVISREVSTRVRAKSFKITTAIMLVGVVGFILALQLIGSIGSASSIGFTSSTTDLIEPVKSITSAVGQTVDTATVDQAAGEQQVRDGSLNALIVGTADNFQVIVKKNLGDDLRGALTVLSRQIALNDEIRSVGGDPAEVNSAVNSAAVTVQALEPTAEFQTERLVIGIIVSIIVYIAVQLYGQMVAQGVVEEKTSRIVEMLLTTIKPWQLMVGKVAGIGLVGLAQLVLVAIVGVGAAVMSGSLDFPTSLAIGAAGWAVAWFLLGFTLYALMFAALGALVSRQEDVGGVTAPAMMLIILPYVAGISILPADPDNKWMAIASIIPFFAPMLMPMRIALGVAPVWEVALAVGLTLLLIVFMVWLSARIYRNAVLRTGSRVKFTQALKAA